MMAKKSYEVTPSKSVTRLIFVDLLRRLTPVGSFKDYQYVGFGALEFIDFDLVHRQVGITDMISIEKDASGIARYEWNKPFSSIKVLAGRASTVLPTIDWSRPSVVWLDYTEQLTEEVIGDVATLARVLVPGSILTITINATPSLYGMDRLEALEHNITAERVPVGTTSNRLGEWGLAGVQYKVLIAELNMALGERGDHARFGQLLNIHYQDKARMQMIAGIISTPQMDEVLDKCRFDEVLETRTGEEALKVRVPILTLRERAWVDQRLPLAEGAALPPMAGVDAKDLSDYAEIYRRLVGAM